MKPFFPWFVYTPKWKENRKRPAEEQFSVRLRDFPESKRLAALEVAARFETSASREELTESKQVRDSVLKSQSEGLAWLVALAKDHIVGVDGLCFAEKEGGEQTEVKTGEDLCSRFEELAVEIGGRLLYGADADEIKN